MKTATPLPTLEERIYLAEQTGDLESLQQIQEVICKHGDSLRRQDPGEMTPRIDVFGAPGMFEELQVEPSVTMEEGFGLDLANRVADSIRWLQFVRDKATRPDKPIVVAEGDSWFLHPLLEDTLDWLRKTDFNVRSIAAAGDTVANMLSDERWLDVVMEEGAHGFLFSGGGNDFLGDGKVDSLVLKEDKGAAPAQLVDVKRVDHLLTRIEDSYRAMLRRLAARANWVRVFSHGYDHVAAVDLGPWIWPYLQHKGYTKPRAVEVMKVLLDHFNDRIGALAKTEPNFEFINMRGVVGTSAAAWDDAIHPKNPGFKKVADKFSASLASFYRRGVAPFTESAYTDGFSAAEGLFSRRKPAYFPTFGNGYAFAPVTRSVPPPAATPVHRRFTEAYRETSHSIATPGELTTFEQVRRLVGMLPPESDWHPGLKESTRKHIRAVRTLLGSAPGGEDTEILKQRVEMMMSSGLDTTGIESIIDLSTRMLDEAAGGDALASQVTEALFGDSELEPVQVLLAGYRAAQAVGKVKIFNQQGQARGVGSGFLVAPGLLLTNHHVLPDKATAVSSRVLFADEMPLDDSLPKPRSFRITGDIYLSSAALDFAFASVAPIGTDGAPLTDYGSLQLIEESGKAVMFETVSIVQHPGGEPKQVAIRNSFVMGRDEVEGIYYTTDTLAGSSGSPVFNRQWQVVALHHAFVPHPVDTASVIANRGIRISSIYKRLREVARQGSPDATRILELLGGPQESGPTPLPPPAPGVSEAPPTEADTVIGSGFHKGSTEAAFLAAIGKHEESVDSDVELPAVFSAGSFESFE